MLTCCSGGGGESAGRFGVGLTSIFATCVHTALISRKQMQQLKRSMKGTKLYSVSIDLLPLVDGAAPAMA
jgi:hypothetical protein